MSSIGQGKYLFAEFQLDATHRIFVREGEVVSLSAKTFDLLHYFVANAQRAISRDELMHAIWPDEEIDESILNQHIFQLRRALTASEPGYRLLAAVPGHGYQFTQPVTEIASGPSASPRLFLHSAASAAPRAPLPSGPARREVPPAEPPAATPPADAPAADPATDPPPPDAPEPRREEPVAEPEETSGPAPAEDAPQPFRTWQDEPWAAAENEPLPDSRPASDSASATSTPAREETPKRWTSPEQRPRKRRTTPRKRRAAVVSDEDGASPRKFALTLPRLLLAAGGLVVLSIAIWLGWKAWRQPHYDGLTLLLTEAENPAGDPEFDQSLTAALALDLNQSPRVALVPRATVAATLKAMQRPAVASITPDLARELCAQIHPQAWLAASVSRVSTRYLISLDVHDCATGLLLAQTRGLADSASDALPLLDRMTGDLRIQLGEPASSVARLSHPLGASVSLAALKVYGQATGPAFAQHPGAAQPLLQQAVAASPQFAQGWAELAIAHYSAAEPAPAVQSLRRAWELRNTADEHSRYAISALYLSRVTGETVSLDANYRAWMAQFPRDPQPFAELADLLIQTGHADQAIDPARHAVTLDPANPGVYTLLARAQMRAGNLDDAAATTKLALTRHVDDPALHAVLFELAYLRHDSVAQEEQRTWAREHKAGPDLDLEQALLLISQGSVKQALEIYETVLADYRRQGMTEAAGRIEAALPRLQAELGLTEDAYVRLEKLPEEIHSADIPVAWAEVGETSHATTILARELAANPAATFWLQNRAPQVRAAIAMEQERPLVAIDALKAAAAWDMSSYELPAMRGRAYLAAREPVLAEYEFLKILDHPGIEPLSPNYPLAQLGLARALAMQGKNLKAAMAYRTFLDDWTLADANLPRLKEARAEMARLPKADTAPVHPK